MNQPIALSEDPIMTVPQVAEYLQISKSKIYYLISRNQLPHLRLGRNVRVRRSDLQNWLNLQIEKVSQPYN
jgi:excisionase family DNA binding protein